MVGEKERFNKLYKAWSTSYQLHQQRIKMLQADSAKMQRLLEGVERVCLDVLHDKSKHDVEILLGTFLGIMSHVQEAKTDDSQS